MSRSLARQAAMQLLYERMTGGDADDESLDLIYEQLTLSQGEPEAEPLKPSRSERVYIQQVLDGVAEHESELDEAIAKHSTGSWSLERIPHVDLSILRLAAYEMAHISSIPGNVSISEAMNMARLYSEPKSGRYINGVLGALEREQRQEQQDKQEEP